MDNLLRLPSFIDPEHSVERARVRVLDDLSHIHPGDPLDIPGAAPRWRLFSKRRVKASATQENVHLLLHAGEHLRSENASTSLEGMPRRRAFPEQRFQMAILSESEPRTGRRRLSGPKRQSPKQGRRPAVARSGHSVAEKPHGRRHFSSLQTSIVQVPSTERAMVRTGTKQVVHPVKGISFRELRSTEYSLEDMVGRSKRRNDARAAQTSTDVFPWARPAEQKPPVDRSHLMFAASPIRTKNQEYEIADNATVRTVSARGQTARADRKRAPRERLHRADDLSPLETRILSIGQNASSSGVEMTGSLQTYTRNISSHQKSSSEGIFEERARPSREGRAARPASVAGTARPYSSSKPPPRPASSIGTENQGKQQVIHSNSRRPHTVNTMRRHDSVQKTTSSPARELELGHMAWESMRAGRDSSLVASSTGWTCMHSFRP